jgi:hypothetical protein
VKSWIFEVELTPSVALVVLAFGSGTSVTILSVGRRFAA